MLPLHLQHLASLMIMTQIMNQFIETIIPYAMYKRRKIQIKSKAEKEAPDGMKPLISGDEIDENIKLQAQIESSKDEYEVFFTPYIAKLHSFPQFC